MAMAMLARALSLRRANQRAKKVNPRLSLSGEQSISESNGTGSLSPGHSDYFHSSRVSQSIDALYVLSCVRDGISLVDTLVSDDESNTVCTRLYEEKPARPSLSFYSERGCPSECAWDCCSSSSLSSRCSDGTSSSLLAPCKAATRQCENCDANTGFPDDFYLLFSKDQQPLLSPSPPTGITSDCCSFLMGRKSNHCEEDVRGIVRKESLREVDGESSKAFSVTRMEKGRGKSGPAGIKVVNFLGKSKRQLATWDPKTDVHDVQRLLRAGTMEIVEKKSVNPYMDFRESMLQMVIATCGTPELCREGDAVGISCADDMNISMEELLYWYLLLNPMELYDLITQAFSDTYSDLLAIKT